MKRFQSPFEKIQRIQQQLLRIAELKLAAAQSTLRAADHRITTLKAEASQYESELATRLQPGNSDIRVADIHAAQHWLESVRISLRKESTHRDTLASELISVRNNYRELKARHDGTQHLIEKMRAQHRQTAIQDEQNQLEEVARTLNWVHQNSDHNFAESAHGIDAGTVGGGDR